MAMSDKKSPYVVQVEEGTYYLCTCGKTEKAPHCDGSHKGSEFRPHKLELEAAKTIAACGCGASGNMPFCDGAHARL